MRLRPVVVTAIVVGGIVAAAAPAAASTVSCDGSARASATGAPKLLTDCGRFDPALGADELADQALQRLAPSLGVRAAQFDVMDASRDPAGRVVRVQQHIGGVPVFDGQIAMRFGDDGALGWVLSSATSARPPSRRPNVTAEQAFSAADVATGRGQLRLAPTTDLVVYPTGAASVLAWHVVVPTTAPADWNVIVDASTGQVITSWNAIQENNSASIYDPNPVQTAGTYTGFHDGGDADTAKLTANRITGFALTHLNGSVNTLKGDFADLTAPGISQGGTLPYVPGSAHSATRDYNYKRSDNRFEEASVYSAITRAQSLIQSLGFDNANNRSIPVDVHYYSADNSFYSDADHALHFGDGGVDDAEDADVVLHEYGHSIQDNQVPGFGPGIEQGAIGEGFGDFFAGMFYLNHGDATYQSTRRYCIADWDATSYNPFNGPSDGSGCLRWIDGTNEFDGSDIGAYSGTPSEVHDDGRYWSAAMTCIFEGMGGNVAARNKVLKLVIAHNAMLVPDSSRHAFEDSVAALRAADQTLFGGTHRALIRSCALDRGLIVAHRPDGT